ncbi:nucleoredoxin-like protein 2 [Rhipicephalus microplus]|uniref:nucleoredoxin-like protein 2 n=1 Tax=Rhipicephalus microplus TaxID=6941 RepID=UPI003F6A9E20
MDLFRGKTLLKKDGTTISADGALRNKRLICIYFAAQWCPPCRVFTPILANAYRRAKDEGLPIEVVFVSSDRNANDMSAYVKSDHEDWPALPYGDALQAGLRARYKVAGIPTLVVVKADGALVSTNGRPDVQTKGYKAFKDWLSCI